MGPPQAQVHRKAEKTPLRRLLERLFRHGGNAPLQPPEVRVVQRVHRFRRQKANRLQIALRRNPFLSLIKLNHL